MKDVFFLGAGFDKEYLQPLMKDFPDDLESLYVDCLHAMEKALTQRMLLQN